MTDPRRSCGLAAKTACLVPVLVLVGLACGTSACGAAQPAGEPRATIHGETLLLELARTPSQQALGLGDRGSLGWGRGMLFLYDSPRFATFWMKGMRFDIDIVWIREGRIVGIAAFVPYPREEGGEPITVPAPELIDMVLEVPAGYAQAKAWQRGDRIELFGL
jgi:uncharacterized membrane protein (UPF0127 family)